MKNKRIFRLLSIILILIPIMVMTHIFAGRNSTNSYTISGILVSTILLSVFGIILIHNRIKYEVTEEKLKSVLDSTAEAIYGFDLKGNCTFANMSCIKILGYNIEADLIGKNMHHLIHHSYRDGSVYPIEDCKILKNAFDGGTHYSIEEVFWKSDGTSFDVEYRSTPKILDGKIDGGVVTFTDITEKKMAAEKIKYLSYHDPITGLYNQTFVNEETKRLDVKRNLPFSIIVGDVNGLKLTNDIFGHEAGDDLLKRIGVAIKKSCRADDIIARVGGDEFIILLPRTNANDANMIRDRIYKEIHDEEFNTIKGGIALGVVTKYDDAEDLFELKKEADVEMYKNKSLWFKENNFKQLIGIMETLHEKSQREKSHSINVSKMAESIAINMNLPSEDIRRAKDGGYYHDIGKIVLDNDILRNIYNLNEEKLVKRRRHPIVGYRILSIFDETMDLAKGALDHHEYWDGTGYPKGLVGEDISLLGRIIAVAEYYDAMTNPLCENRMSLEEIKKDIINKSGIKFDPNVVNAFKKIIV